VKPLTTITVTGRSCGTRSAFEERRTAALSATALVLAVVAGVLIALELIRPVHFVDDGVRAAVESVIIVAALLTARLLLAVVDSGLLLRELLLLAGVSALSIAGFAFWAGPTIAGVRTTAPDGTVRLVCELAGAVALAAAALTPLGASVRPLRGRTRLAAALGLGAIAVAMVVLTALAAHATMSAPKDAGVATAGDVLSVSANVLSAALLVVAGVAFVARSRQAARGDQLLAAACLLLAAAGMQFVATPSVPASWVTSRDGARLAAFALLLGAAYLRYASVQRARADTALRSERERVARDLHDGLAQDLACITAQAQRLDYHLDPQHPLVLASRDALAELRTLIADLTASTTDTTDEAVQLVARDLRRRLDPDVDVDVDARAAVDRMLSRTTGSAPEAPADQAAHTRPPRGMSRLSAPRRRVRRSRFHRTVSRP